MEYENKTYENLNDRQKALIDAIAITRVRGDDLTNKEITELAEERSGEKQYHPTYVPTIKDKYGDIIEERVQYHSNINDRDEGEVVTKGSPLASYTGPEKGIDLTDQNITERPVKETPSEEDGDEMMLLPVSEDIIFKMLRVDDEEVALWVFDQLIEDD